MSDEVIAACAITADDQREMRDTVGGGYYVENTIVFSCSVRFSVRIDLDIRTGRPTGECRVSWPGGSPDNCVEAMTQATQIMEAVQLAAKIETILNYHIDRVTRAAVMDGADIGPAFTAARRAHRESSDNISERVEAVRNGTYRDGD